MEFSARCRRISQFTALRSPERVARANQAPWEGPVLVAHDHIRRDGTLWCDYSTLGVRALTYWNEPRENKMPRGSGEAFNVFDSDTSTPTRTVYLAGQIATTTNPAAGGGQRVTTTKDANGTAR